MCGLLSAGVELIDRGVSSGGWFVRLALSTVALWVDHLSTGCGPDEPLIGCGFRGPTLVVGDPVVVSAQRCKRPRVLFIHPDHEHMWKISSSLG